MRTVFIILIVKVLIDGPQSITGIHRQVIGLKRLSLTDIVVEKLPRCATQKNIIKAWTVTDIFNFALPIFFYLFLLYYRSKVHLENGKQLHGLRS